MLAAIQRIVDQNTLNSSYITVRQMALELLHLTQKHGLDTQLVERLARTEEVSYSWWRG